MANQYSHCRAFMAFNTTGLGQNATFCRLYLTNTGSYTTGTGAVPALIGTVAQSGVMPITSGNMGTTFLAPLSNTTSYSNLADEANFTIMPTFPTSAINNSGFTQIGIQCTDTGPYTAPYDQYVKFYASESNSAFRPYLQITIQIPVPARIPGRLAGMDNLTNFAGI